MPIEVYWGNAEKTVLMSKLSGLWTLEDYHAMIDDIYRLVSSVNHPIYLVSDFSASEISPTRLLSAGRHMEMKSEDTKHKIIFSVVVSAGNFLKGLASVVQKLFLKDAKLYFVDSMEDATRIIEQHRQSSGAT